MSWLWPNFKPEEILSPNGLLLFGEGVLIYSPDMLDRLEAFRAEINKPILINHKGLALRGYRSPKENEMAGGKKFSMHLLGIAADCTVPDMTSAELAEHALRSELFTGIGIYDTFVHLDSRYVLDDKIRRWEG